MSGTACALCFLALIILCSMHDCTTFLFNPPLEHAGKLSIAPDRQREIHQGDNGAVSDNQGGTCARWASAEKHAQGVS